MLQWYWNIVKIVKTNIKRSLRICVKCQSDNMFDFSIMGYIKIVHLQMRFRVVLQFYDSVLEYIKGTFLWLWEEHYIPAELPTTLEEFIVYC